MKSSPNNNQQHSNAIHPNNNNNPISHLLPSLLKDFHIPEKYQEKLAATLGELFQLEYEKQMKGLRGEVSYWKRRSGSSGSAAGSMNHAFVPSGGMDSSATTETNSGIISSSQKNLPDSSPSQNHNNSNNKQKASEMKLQLISDIIHQISSFETEQSQWKQYLDSFVNQQSSSVSQMQENYKLYAKELSREKDNFKQEAMEKLQSYDTMEGHMNEALEEMRAWMQKGNQQLETQKRRIQQLEAENDSLRKKMADMSSDTLHWNQQRDREVKKWKDISLLTIPLVEMVNRSMTTRQSVDLQNFEDKSSLQKQQQEGSRNQQLGQVTPSVDVSASMLDAIKQHLHEAESTSANLTESLHHASAQQQQHQDEDEDEQVPTIPVRVSATLDDSLESEDDPQNNTTLMQSTSPRVPSVIVRRSNRGTLHQVGETLDATRSSKRSSRSPLTSPSSSIRMSLQNTKQRNHASNGNIELQLTSSEMDNWPRDYLSSSSTNNQQKRPSMENILIHAPPSIQQMECKRIIQHQIGHKSKRADHVDGSAKRAKFHHPVSIAVNAQNKMCIVAEAGNHCLRKVNLEDNLVSTVTNPGGKHSKKAQNSSKSASLLDCPGGVCFDSTNPMHLFVTDLNQNKIFSVDIQSGALTALKMKCTQRPKISTQLPFSNPYDCIMARTDNSVLYVTHDTGIAMIQLKSRECTFVGPAAGGSTKKRGHRDGSFAKALFDRPNGMAFVDSQRLFVCDTGNHVIRCIDFSNRTVSTLAGKAGYACLRDGILSDACFSSPRKICALTGQGRELLFVTEDNTNIRVIDLQEGRVQTISMADAPLQSPFGIGARYSTSHDDCIELYIADCNMHIVRHVEMDLFGDVETPNRGGAATEDSLFEDDDSTQNEVDDGSF